MPKKLTGWHVFAMFVGCFSVIIAVNLTLAFNAVASFPGLVTKNSYVASQHFDTDRKAQDDLGWALEASLRGGVLQVAIEDTAGQPVFPEVTKAVLGRATHVAEDVIPVFAVSGRALEAQVSVPDGYWTLWLELEAEDGTAFRRRIPLILEKG